MNWVGIDDPCLIIGNNPVECVLSVSLVAGCNISIINYRTSNNMSLASDIIMKCGLKRCHVNWTTYTLKQ